MTGFASATGHADSFSWTWDLRAVNGKGLDLRLRVPDWIDGLEAELRGRLAAAIGRGNVTLSLRLTREDQATGVQVNQAQLAQVLDALAQIEDAAHARNISIAPASSTEIASMKGVLEVSTQEDDTKNLKAQLIADVDGLIAAFNDMRSQEGASLAQVLDRQLSEIETLTQEAARLAEARKEEMAATLKANLAKVMANADGLDPDRLAQELAVLAVKADVTEEIDRLTTHVGAARLLLGEARLVGRKLDFLMQEFNREANTLCSKSQNADLTRVGLALKALIDQMREQVQNVE